MFLKPGEESKEGVLNDYDYQLETGEKEATIRYIYTKLGGHRIKQVSEVTFFG